MLRQAFIGSSRAAGAHSRRCWLATKAQKRALNPDQLSGSEAPPPPPPSAGVPPAATVSSTPPPPGGGSSSLLPLGAVGLLAAGGAAYYYYSTTLEQTSPSTSIPQVETVTSTKEERKEPEPATREEVSTSSNTKAPSEATTKATDTGGNRVLSIAVPSKMKNVAAAEESGTLPSHPVSGNRVTNVFRAEKSQQQPVNVEDTSMTLSAVKALTNSSTEAASEALLQSHQSLWSSMDATFFSDLDQLSNAQLKARVVQLATEMKDRTKWEAVRLKEFLAMKEKETAEKYLEILQKQRLEFEDIIAKRLRGQEHELSTQMHTALREKETTIQSVLSTALEAQQNEHESDKKAFEEIITGEIRSALDEEYGKQLEEHKSQVAQALQQKVATLNTLTKKLQHLESALEASKTSKVGSLKAHRLSASALALADKLETNKSAASELAALKLAAGNEGVISTACATIPNAVKVGVPTLPELQTRFEAARKKCRQAALVPAGRLGLEGQLAGMVFASLKYPPNPDDPAPESDKDSAEYILVRAQKHVHLGELEQAVEQLEKLNGQPAFTIADWKKVAIDRIAVEKALKVIKMECALLNESCLEEE